MVKRYTILLFFQSLFSLVTAQEHKTFHFLVPDHAKLQFAGGIGFLSAGIGYDSRKHNLQGDFYYGYVPESLGGVTIHSVTGKLTWTPLIYRFKKNHVNLDILSLGLLVNYAFGKQYFSFSPEYYPFDYYKFPTSLHAGIFAGGGIRFKKLGFYYEVGTTDDELLSYVQNIKSLKFTDILNIGIGVEYSFKRHYN